MSKSRITSIIITAVCFLMLSSCFTGIESTKKINLSRDERKKAAPTQEELFFPGIQPTPLKDWLPGRQFMASDNKAILAFESWRSPFLNDSISMKGKILDFESVRTSIGADGNLNLIIVFSDGNRKFLYDTGKNFDSALETVESDDLPMLIDLKMVEDAKEQLAGKMVWTRSNLWYDDKDERIDGKKYVPVTITDVTPGNFVFPLRLKLTDERGTDFNMFMNFGNSNTESRSFHNLFSLTDLRKNYPTIQPEIWDLICEGKVTNGMTKLECRLALGNPVDIASGHDYSQTLDIWTFENGIILWFEDGKLTRHKS